METNGEGQLTVKGSGLSFWNDENILKLIRLQMYNFVNILKTTELNIVNR